MDKIIWLLFGFTWGALLGFIAGLWYYAKKVHRLITPKEVTRETINSIITGNEPKGEFIKVNKVEEYLKENVGAEVSIGDVIDDTI